MNEQQSGQTKSEPVSIAMIAGLHLEIAPLLGLLDVRRTATGNGFKYHNCFLNDIRIVVCEKAVGENRAKSATNAVIDVFDPEWILSVGISGALLEPMLVGHIAVANGLVRARRPDPIDVPVGMESDPAGGLFVGRICTTDHIVRTREEKQALHDQTGAIAVDMESFAVAQTARQRGKNVMAIRSISDTMEKDLPPEVLAIFGGKGTIRMGALAGTLFKRPGSVKELWKIREDAVTAARSLARFVLGVLPQLTSVSENSRNP